MEPKQNLHKYSKKLREIIPFILSILVLSIIAKINLYNSGTASPGFLSFSDAIVISFVLVFLPLKLRRFTEVVLLSSVAILDVIEAFLVKNFNLHIEPTSLQLLCGTDMREAGGFFSQFVLQYSSALLIGEYILAAIVIFSIYYIFNKAKKTSINKIPEVISLFCALIMIFSLCVQCKYYKQRIGYLRMLNSSSTYAFLRNAIEDYEGTGIGNYSPLLRLIYSIKANSFTEKENQELYEVSKDVTIDGVNDSSPLIVFWIGESYIKRHSQLYGYKLHTTPYELEEYNAGRLFVFDDAITTKNITFMSFQNMLSTASIDSRHEWYQRPLFPQLLKLGGYYTSFISNQFTINNDSGKQIFDYGAISFLLEERMRCLFFDYMNKCIYKYDDELLNDIDYVFGKNNKKNFIIFHGIGQHHPFVDRYPDKFGKFDANSYSFRKDLSSEEKKILAQYDNATLYQDYIAHLLFEKIKNREAIVVFVSDHGEEIFDENHNYKRHHNQYTPDVLRAEYEIPMWIWCSDSYIENNTDVVCEIAKSTHRAFMTDDIGQIFLRLSGISCKYFDEKRCLISSNFVQRKKRLIGQEHNIDYNSIMNEK